jgi:hypothetical protein
VARLQGAKGSGMMSQSETLSSSRGYFSKTSIFVILGDIFGFLWLSLALKNLMKLINSNLDH